LDLFGGEFVPRAADQHGLVLRQHGSSELVPERFNLAALFVEQVEKRAELRVIRGDGLAVGANNSDPRRHGRGSVCDSGFASVKTSCLAVSNLPARGSSRAQLAISRIRGQMLFSPTQG
jgi:hypothetical protein